MLTHDMNQIHDPNGTIVARFDNYLDAQAAVDRLADADAFDVSGTRIVATDLRIVEQVTGKRGWLSTLGSGALNGATVGAFLTLVIGAFSIIGSIGAFWSFVLWGITLGAVVGAWLSALDYWSHFGRRDFFSIQRLTAAHYDVVVPPHQAELARRLVSSSATAGGPQDTTA